jgi:hypothetical protein
MCTQILEDDQDLFFYFLEFRWGFYVEEQQ